MSNKGKIYLASLFLASFALFHISSSCAYVSVNEFPRILKTTLQKSLFGQNVALFAAILGSLVAFFTLDELNSRLMYTIFGLIVATMSSLLTFNTSYTLYLAISFVRGFSSSILAIIPNVFITSLFRNSKSSYLKCLSIMHSLQSVFAFISVSAVMPFIHFDGEGDDDGGDDDPEEKILSLFNGTKIKEIFNRNSIHMLKSNSLQSLENDIENEMQIGLDLNKLFDGKNRSDLYKPYLVIAGIQLVACILLHLNYMFNKQSPKNDNNNDDKKDIEDGDDNKKDPALKFTDIYKIGKLYLTNWYRVMFIILVSLILALSTISETNMYFNYINYIIWECPLIQSDNAIVFIGLSFFIPLNISKLANIFTITKVSLQTSLFCSFILIALGNILLHSMIKVSLLPMYGSLALLGIGYSNVYSNLISILEERIGLSNKGMSFIYTMLIIFTKLAYENSENLLNKDHINFIKISFIPIVLALLAFVALIIVEQLRLNSASRKYLNENIEIETEIKCEIKLDHKCSKIYSNHI